jgi:signal transduction histidine kinase
MSGRILAINETAAQLLEVESAAVAGREFADVLAADHPLKSTLTEVLGTRQLVSYRENRWSERVVGISMSFVRNDKGTAVGLWILCFDLSELAAMREKLESQKRLSALGEMAGGLAHQLRNSMGAISGYATLVKKHLHQSGSAGAQVESLLEETRQADQLIRRFLSFARPLECVPVPLAVDPVVEEIADSFRVRPDFAAVIIHTTPGADGQVLLDSLLFKQALGNLIENAALAYADRHGTIEIVSSVRGREIVIEISDTGCGIPSDKLERVFTPFYSSRPDGTGLGLPLAARIIEMHQGRLTLTSIVGRGTTATIILPLAHVGTATVRATAPSVIS